MSQQTLDLRRSFLIVRRHKALVGIVAVLGLLIGAAYVAVHPPKLTSQAQVILPNSVPSMATEVLIASSDPVLTGALPGIKPATSIQQLRSDIHVKSLTNYLISISAEGTTAAQAESTANAVANSYVLYVSSPDSPMRTPARVLEPATTATGVSLPAQLLIFGLTGAIVGGLIGAIVSLVIGRKDRRLRERDEIASSIGLPVLASLAVDHPDSPAGWARLLREYEPAAAAGWRLCIALQQLGVTDTTARDAAASGGNSLAVLTLASDPAALALAPQVAVIAAATGIKAALVVGPQQDPNAAAALRAACAALPPDAAAGLGNLRVVVRDGHDLGAELDVDLAVVVAVVDGRGPKVSDTARATTTVLGVSAGTATADELARVAASAAADGRDVVGVFLANPEPNDRTTGRVPDLTRRARRRGPTRVAVHQRR